MKKEEKSDFSSLFFIFWCMDTPLVSVLICSYNAEKTIRWTLESVLAQTYQNFEVLVLDNDSHDKTREILEEYQKNDGRVKLFSVGKNL
ncbi:glycosyltransferase family 2 protein [bacterium]|nr:glycosyltransferase family 2 protein [bacterium]